MKEFIRIAIGTLVLLSLLSGFIYLLASGSKKHDKEATKSYIECKRLTKDVEWCFKKFNPELK